MAGDEFEVHVRGGAGGLLIGGDGSAAEHDGPAAAAAAVSRLCVCIGSLCLRHCVHGASIIGSSRTAATTRQGWQGSRWRGGRARQRAIFSAAPGQPAREGRARWGRRAPAAASIAREGAGRRCAWRSGRRRHRLDDSARVEPRVMYRMVSETLLLPLVTPPVDRALSCRARAVCPSYTIIM
jgi:hypothetical protein